MYCTNFKDYLKRDLQAEPWDKGVYDGKEFDPNKCEKKKPDRKKFKVCEFWTPIVIDSKDRLDPDNSTPLEFQVSTKSTDAGYQIESEQKKGSWSDYQRSQRASLEDSLKNVKHIRLEECIMPDWSGELSHVILQIPELRRQTLGTNQNLRNAFSVLIPERVHGPYVTCKPWNQSLCQKTFNPPLAQLNMLTIKLIPHQDSTPSLDDFFRDQTSLEDPKPYLYNSLFVFNVCQEIPDMDKEIVYQNIT